MSIQPIAPIMPLGAMNLISSGDGAQKAGTDFSKFLNDALSQVEALQTKADAASLQLATGKVQDISEVMVALEKANLSMSLTISVRDKMLDAYNQVMRMQM